MKLKSYLFLLTACLLLSCSDDEQEQIEEQQVQLPEVVTETNSSEAVVTLTSIEIKGSIVKTEDPLQSYGVVWSNDPDPTINDNIIEVDVEAQNLLKTQQSANSNLEFSVVVDDLDPGKNYYFRIYAQNEAGTAYGEELAIETLSLAGTKWDFHFVHSNSQTSGVQVEWDAVVEFYEDGTAFYTEPASGDMYDFNGFYSLDGNTLTYNLTGDPENTAYILNGTIEKDSITGTFWEGEENFTAQKQ
ncbi:hypothetical protein GCM10023115_40360 [Pontixanthobacter gangjinensis]|uniref:Fibronectin type-III domain-containing protein n=1 Tax=Christiangramia aestuarii TaxID=1028746 RepID=A0A7K1LRZ6_9FLAO|nr:fibronectin type III domain-containing protein [Christiangramia aestuarii]MUP43579.1 hypothetical protein [Christiangramia aestuarii]